MSGVTVEFSDDSFDTDVLSSKVPVLVDFWAPWCGPCKAMNPTIEELAHEQSGKWIVGKLNIQDNPKIAGRLGIRSIPMLMFFHHGQCKATLMGTQSKQNIVKKMMEITD